LEIGMLAKLKKVWALQTLLALAVTTVVIAQSPISSVSAVAARIWTITISGNCENQAATSDWEAVTGRPPRNAPTITPFAVGDTLRIVNNCDVPTNSQQNYTGQLVVYEYPTSWSMPNLPILASAPVFSDGATWTPAADANSWASGTIGNGKYVDLVLAANTGDFKFQQMFGPFQGSEAFASGSWYGKFAVASLEVSSGGNPVTQIVASQGSPISTITASFTGYGSRGRFNPFLLTLPPGLSITSSCPGFSCPSPITIGGTPTQDGVYTVSFVGTDVQQAWDGVGFAQTLEIIVGSVITPSTQTVSGSTGSAISATTAFTSSNFTGAVSYAVTSGTLPAGLVISSSTGVVSGTPTTASTDTVTITATGATTGSATATVTFAIDQASISPTTQTVSGTAGTAIAATTAFTPTNITGAVSYAVTSGSLPAGLVISSSTGVIGGTPSAASTASVTITATGATAGSATATVTFAIAAAPATTTTTAPATSTTIPATTTAPSGPANVTASNQATLTRTPGAATALVNGQPVTVAVETPADLPAAQVDPEDRSPAQVQSLQVAADNLVDQLNQAAGGNSGLAVQDTPTGAAITGLLTTPVPIENTVLVEAANKSTLFAALNEDGSVTEVQPGAVIEVLGDGQVGVVASGLTPGETAEFVIMSTPTLLGSYTVSANGTIKAQASLPAGVGLGDHTLVVASPTVQASLGLKVSATPATLPATGISNGSNTLQIALWLLVGGSLVAYLRRRRNILN
jgi:LPXTG-motif cell wall-anchored protein